MTVRIRVLYLIIIIESEVWPIFHCVGISHGTVVWAVILSILFINSQEIYVTPPWSAAVTDPIWYVLWTIYCSHKVLSVSSVPVMQNVIGIYQRLLLLNVPYRQHWVSLRFSWGNYSTEYICITFKNLYLAAPYRLVSGIIFIQTTATRSKTPRGINSNCYHNW